MEKNDRITRTLVSVLSAKVARIVGVDQGVLGGIQAMRFLLRVAFWLSIVIVLLPTAPSQKASETPQVSATEAVSAASAAVSDMRQFCSRQPDACEVGSHAITTFGQKAQAGAKLLYEFLSERFGPERNGSIGATTGSKPSQHTLTPSDLTPAWRGSVREPNGRQPA